MADWMVWLVAAGVLVGLELFSGTFYLLMIALGLLFGALAALLGLGVPLQIVSAAVVGIVATELLRRRRPRKRVDPGARRDPNVNIDIGQPIRVGQWNGRQARTMYRGALWDVELAPEAHAQGDEFRIVEVQGSRLIVTNASVHMK